MKKKQANGKTKNMVTKETVRGKAENLDRLLKTDVLDAFVEENNGEWDHQKWIALSGKITGMGFSPIDFDQVGLALEGIKARYNLSDPQRQ